MIGIARHLHGVIVVAVPCEQERFDQRVGFLLRQPPFGQIALIEGQQLHIRPAEAVVAHALERAGHSAHEGQRVERLVKRARRVPGRIGGGFGNAFKTRALFSVRCALQPFLSGAGEFFGDGLQAQQAANSGAQKVLFRFGTGRFQLGAGRVAEALQPAGENRLAVVVEVLARVGVGAADEIEQVFALLVPHAGQRGILIPEQM